MADRANTDLQSACLDFSVLNPIFVLSRKALIDEAREDTAVGRALAASGTATRHSRTPVTRPSASVPRRPRRHLWQSRFENDIERVCDDASIH